MVDVKNKKNNPKIVPLAPVPLPSENAGYYQIGQDDLAGGFSGLAQKFNMETPELMAANPGISTLSRGSYITQPNWMGGNASQMSLSRGTFRGYTTGENERKSFTGPDGNIVRVGPNSSVTPGAQTNTLSPWQRFMNLLKGGNGSSVPDEPSGTTGVRGFAPTGGGAKNARPTAFDQITGAEGRGVAVSNSAGGTYFSGASRNGAANTTRSNGAVVGNTDMPASYLNYSNLAARPAIGLAQELKSLYSGIDTAVRQYGITGQQDYSLLPANVSIGAASQAAQQYGVTPYEWATQNGYTYQNGQYVRSGNGQQNNGAAGQVGYNPSGNKGGWTLVRDKNGKLVMKLMGRRPTVGPAVQAAATPENASSGPTGVLSLRMGYS